MAVRLSQIAWCRISRNYCSWCCCWAAKLCCYPPEIGFSPSNQAIPRSSMALSGFLRYKKALLEAGSWRSPALGKLLQSWAPKRSWRSCIEIWIFGTRQARVVKMTIVGIKQTSFADWHFILVTFCVSHDPRFRIGLNTNGWLSLWQHEVVDWPVNKDGRIGAQGWQQECGWGQMGMLIAICTQPSTEMVTFYRKPDSFSTHTWSRTSMIIRNYWGKTIKARWREKQPSPILFNLHDRASVIDTL